MSEIDEGEYSIAALRKVLRARSIQTVANQLGVKLRRSCERARGSLDDVETQRATSWPAPVSATTRIWIDPN